MGPDFAAELDNMPLEVEAEAEAEMEAEVPLLGDLRLESGAAVGATVGADVPDELLAEVRAKSDLDCSFTGGADDGDAATHATGLEPCSPFSMHTRC